MDESLKQLSVSGFKHALEGPSFFLHVVKIYEDMDNNSYGTTMKISKD